MEQHREENPEPENTGPRLVVGEPEPQEPAELKSEVNEPEPEPEEEGEDESSIKPPTPEEIRDNVIEIRDRAKEVLMGPAWEAIRTYGKGARDGVNAVFDGIVGKKKK